MLPYGNCPSCVTSLLLPGGHRLTRCRTWTVHPLLRLPGTPHEYWWRRVEDWPDARGGLEPEIAEFVCDMRGWLSP